MLNKQYALLSQLRLLTHVYGIATVLHFDFAAKSGSGMSGVVSQEDKEDLLGRV